MYTFLEASWCLVKRLSDFRFSISSVDFLKYKSLVYLMRKTPIKEQNSYLLPPFLGERKMKFHSRSKRSDAYKKIVYLSFTVCAGIFTYSLRSHNFENTVNIKSVENIFSFYIFCTSLLITDSLSRMEPLDKIGTFAINSANDSTNISSRATILDWLHSTQNGGF